MNIITNKKQHFSFSYSFFTLLYISVALFLPLILKGKTAFISYEQARQIAQKHVHVAPKTSTRVGQTIRNNTQKLPYYLFNDASGKGFVLVSGHTEMGEILAYSTTNTLDTLHANDGVKMLLQGYKARFSELNTPHVATRAMAQAVKLSKVVKPMLTSSWGQGYPYNVETGFPYTGCVATAIAQLMYYYKFPERGKGEKQYHVGYYNVDKNIDFTQSHYDWQNMLPSYQYPVRATDVQEHAVGKLMSDVGIACYMQYAPHYSGAQTINGFYALQNHFNYKTVYLSRATEGAARFEEIIKKEISQGYPVYMSGSPAGGGAGHAWVVDGMDKNGLLHMNFGWDGQSNAYYSLTALNVSNTGSEFNGRPLGFNRGLEALLARPNTPNFPDYPIELLISSPRLMFNDEGYFKLSEQAYQALNLFSPLSVSFNYFVNRGQKFKGDIGVDVVNEQGDVVLTAYSSDHEQGGFTQREYGNLESGYMNSDYLMNREQRFSLNLSALTKGYYTLIPIAIIRKDNGSWGDKIKMINAPEIEIEVENGMAKVVEASETTPTFQQKINSDFVNKGRKGEEVDTYFSIRNLSGITKHAFVSLQMLNQQGQEVLKTHSHKAFAFNGFSTVEVPFSFMLPTDLAEGTYQLKLTLLTPDENEGFTETPIERFEVKNIRNKEAQTFEVLPQVETPFMQQVEFSITDNSETDIASNSIMLDRWSQFKFKLQLKTSEGKSYKGGIEVVCKEKEGSESVTLKGFQNTETIVSTGTTSLLSFWYRASSLPLNEGKTYEVQVFATINGKKELLKSPTNTTYFLTRKDNVLTLSSEMPTAISPQEAETNAPKLVQTPSTLTFLAPNISAVSFYNTMGQCVKRINVPKQEQVVVAKEGLLKGTVIVIIHCNNKRFVQKTYIQ